MTVIPGQQNVSTFLGGGYNSPQPLQAQIPGTSALPQITPPSLANAAQPNQSQSLTSPTSNNFNSLLLQQLAGGATNSGINHSVSGSDLKPSFFPQQSQMMTGMFGPKLMGGY